LSLDELREGRVEVGRETFKSDMAQGSPYTKSAALPPVPSSYAAKKSSRT